MSASNVISLKPVYNTIEINGHKYEIDPTDYTFQECFEAATTRLQKVLLSNGADLQAGKQTTSESFKELCEAVAKYINDVLGNPNAAADLLGDNTSGAVALYAQQAVQSAVVAALKKRTLEISKLSKEFSKRPVS